MYNLFRHRCVCKIMINKIKILLFVGAILLTSAIITTYPAQAETGKGKDAFIMTTKDLKPICTTGNNSPANRPEFVDLSLNATGQITQAIQQEENGENESDED